MRNNEDDYIDVKTRLCFTIPLCVAEQCFMVSGRAAVLSGDRVYVGPGRNILGIIWSALGKRTVVC